MKKTIALLLTLALLLPVFAGCAEGGNTDESETTPSGTTVTPTETEPAAETTRLYKADIPAGTDYDGATFTVLTFPNDGGIWGDVDWSAEELTAETLNDRARLHDRTRRHGDP